MFHTLTRSTFAVTLAIAVGATALPAAARSTVAFVGRPNYPADAGCFSEWFGAIKNNCSSMRLFTVPLATDSAGYHSVTVSGYGPSSSANIGCRAFGIVKSTTYTTPTFYGGSQRWLSKFGVADDIQLPQTYVPADGSLFVCCDVNPGGQVNLIDYTW